MIKNYQENSYQMLNRIDQLVKPILPVFKIAIIFLFLLATSFGVYGQNAWTSNIPTPADNVEIPAASNVIVDGADEEITSVSAGDEHLKYIMLQKSGLYFKIKLAGFGIKNYRKD